MGLSWQQGPLSTGAIGRFLVPEPVPKRLLYVEPLRRRMRVRFGERWIADSENVLLLFEPARYPVAYFPESDVSPQTLERTEHTTQHADLGLTSWYSVRADEQHVAPRGAWQPTRGSCRHASRSPGARWMLSTRKTNELWAMPPTATTASTFARLRVTSWYAMVTGSLPIPSVRWSSQSPASRRAGTFRAPISMRPRSLP